MDDEKGTNGRARNQSASAPGLGWPPESDVGWAGVPQRLIINLQMGSWASGIEPGGPGWDEQPGPAGNTYFRARNVWVGRTRAW
ncbi:hypothetical protein GCM10020216_015630 [Nonomuraea helvata]